ncbi:MAG TPA: nitrate reductase subunit beta [Pyrinomonadaceae bacterium]|nr:nitrate reductase subunit beta [Chloracidobacterium sp.]MBP9935937.1 nitrate reductase subunit beta [Pyrinomonadaceae bacterium]MBK7801083.1 nitrate reductase subunit beta [Chloracidobacterium sp.]MBK9436409.1 nitrate reductase subunit beta [Chloracidobacterium sp.]MBL0241389.1 nitrate reductase subunit beta [Chloracidobacterium sp.]
MDVRLQTSMVFHLDKCIGCHTCSVACKNVWTDRKGAEYMWWNNVETKPGTGYPTAWEDQEKYNGGWKKKDGAPDLKMGGKSSRLLNIFHNPDLPKLDDYYEPWTYEYEELFDAPEGADQPTARPISLITGEYMNIEAGPNWDDDLSGSPIYAANDPNLSSLTEQQREELFDIEKLVFFYLPRICNHCLNPACVAACPSGAIYKRGEDGVVLINQDKCRAWRMCVTACPYKKTFYNWSTGKSEKCILCFPRLETGQAPACFHSCVGRIRYLGGLLYDADRLTDSVNVPDGQLVDSHRDIILDPKDPKVREAARKNGIDDRTLEAIERSPVYKYVKEWKLALPLHPEFRTLPMLFYVPPMLPVMAETTDGVYDTANDELFSPIEKARLPIEYMASLFSAGNVDHVSYALKKQYAVRLFKRLETVGDVSKEVVQYALDECNMTPEEAEAIYRLTSLPTMDERVVIPPSHREEALAMLNDNMWEEKGSAGLGRRQLPVRGA